MAVTGRRRESRQGTVSARQIDLVERAEVLLRAHVAHPVPLSTVCRHLGLSERTLRNAFYGVRGMSPRQCMLAERLEGVRRALRHPGGSTVTRVATDYGFYELGRFAATYRQFFGETPSDTLRGASRQSARAHDEQKGLPDVCTT